MQGRTCKQYIFRSYNTFTFSATRFDENPFTCQCEKEDKKAEGFQISLSYWSFTNDVTAVKGLRILISVPDPRSNYIFVCPIDAAASLSYDFTSVLAPSTSCMFCILVVKLVDELVGCLNGLLIGW